MPSLIGSAPNQVPTNGMLGTLAFQDSDSAIVGAITATTSANVPTATVTTNNTTAASTAFVQSSILARQEVLTTAGTSTAYTVTTSVLAASYLPGIEFTVKFHTNCGANPTISIDGNTPIFLTYQNYNGAYVQFKAGELTQSFTSKIRYIVGTNVFEVVEKRFTRDSEATSPTNEHTVLSPYTLRSALNATGTAPIYACRAWVNFNGTGTVATNASGNVSSVSDLGTGKYRVNFTTAMPDVNYSWMGSASAPLTSDANRILVDRRADSTKTTSALDVRVMAGGTQADITDSADVCVAVFR